MMTESDGDAQNFYDGNYGKPKRGNDMATDRLVEQPRADGRRSSPP